MTANGTGMKTVTIYQTVKESNMEKISHSAFHSGFAVIAGRPNVGKSTLLNALIGEKIAIVSDRPQTTRNTVVGILNSPDSQLVFVDTPGYHTPRTRLGNYMMQTWQDAMQGVDVLLVLIDVTAVVPKDRQLAGELGKKKCRKLLLLNKTDLVEPQKLLSLIDSFKNDGFDEIYPISAKEGDGLEELKKDLLSHLPEGPKYYPDDSVTSQTERQIASEIIREKALRNLRDEVPHGIGVEIMRFSESENLITIYANIFCEKESHKWIIIGKGGSMIKLIGSQARQDIESLLGIQVNLQLWVKVRPDWRNNPADLKDLGYSSDK